MNNIQTFMGKYPMNQNPSQLTQVPINGPLKSTSLILQQQMSYLNYPPSINGVSGMMGQVL